MDSREGLRSSVDGMKISDIKGQKKNKSRFSIYVDGKYSFSLNRETLNREALYIGEEIDEKRLEKLILKDEFFRARDYGLLLLSYRDRSEFEFRKRLMEKNFHPEVVMEVVEYFKNEKLINDLVFAEKWLDSILNSRPMGGFRARHELKQKMVSDDIIQEVVQNKLDHTMEESLAKRAVAKKMKSLAGYPDEVARRRLLQFLKSRGFRFDIIEALMKEQFRDDLG